MTIFIYRTPAAQDVCHLNALFMFVATHTVALDYDWFNYDVACAVTVLMRMSNP